MQNSSAEMEVIVGTYEEFLLGYKLDTKNEKQQLVQSFADKSHAGSLKCLAVQSHFIATGATDDRVFVYDMRTRKQVQIILSHEGTINALAFTPDNTHLLSGGEDGRMIATRLNTWMSEGNWKAHNGAAVTHISCHPSGKLALTLGTDRVLRTWNLVKGRVAYKTNLKSRNSLGAQPDCLSWSPDGEHFTLCGQRVIEIWSIKTADVVRSQKTTAKPVSVCWLGDKVCVCGLEDGKLQWVLLDSEEKEGKIIEVHTARVKAMAYYNDCLVTASSSGELKLWQVNIEGRQLKLIACINTGCRPTCLGILDLKQFGPSYRVGTAVVESHKPTKVSGQQTQQPQRGVVTIEYEEDKDTGAGNESDDNDSEEEEDDILSEAEKSKSSDDSEEDDDASVSADDEPIIKLPKSRKRKQAVLKSQTSEKIVSKQKKESKVSRKAGKQKFKTQTNK